MFKLVSGNTGVYSTVTQASVSYSLGSGSMSLKLRQFMMSDDEALSYLRRNAVHAFSYRAEEYEKWEDKEMGVEILPAQVFVVCVWSVKFSSMYTGYFMTKYTILPRYPSIAGFTSGVVDLFIIDKKYFLPVLENPVY